MKTPNDNKKKKSIETYSIDNETKERLKQKAIETGISKSELNRMAVNQFLDGACDNAVVMLNVVMLTEVIHDIKENIPEHQYEQLEQYIGNITTLKGGHRNGGI